MAKSYQTYSPRPGSPLLHTPDVYGEQREEGRQREHGPTTKTKPFRFASDLRAEERAARAAEVAARAEEDRLKTLAAKVISRMKKGKWIGLKKLGPRPPASDAKACAEWDRQRNEMMYDAAVTLQACIRAALTRRALAERMADVSDSLSFGGTSM